jgi:hypothetical protein
MPSQAGVITHGPMYSDPLCSVRDYGDHGTSAPGELVAGGQAILHYGGPSSGLRRPSIMEAHYFVRDPFPDGGGRSEFVSMIVSDFSPLILPHRIIRFTSKQPAATTPPLSEPSFWQCPPGYGPLYKNCEQFEKQMVFLLQAKMTWYAFLVFDIFLLMLTMLTENASVNTQDRDSDYSISIAGASDIISGEEDDATQTWQTVGETSGISSSLASEAAYEAVNPFRR